MNSIEERDNLIIMLQEALKFYADSNSYRIPAESDGDYRYNCMRPEFHLTRVEIDCGSQARFALEKVEALNRMNQKMQEDYDKLTNGLLDAVDNSVDTVDMYDKINAIRTLGDKIYGDKI